MGAIGIRRAGTPEFEIRAATPENGLFNVLASIPASRVPIWQIVNPALSPNGKWLAQALTDGFTTNIWALSTTTGQWKQITDFSETRNIHRPPRVLVVRRALDSGRGRRRRFRYRSAGRADEWRAPVSRGSSIYLCPRILGG
jgi:hypothetical protein